MALSNGFYVAITNNSIKPIIKYEGIEVSPGEVTNIGIKRSFYYKQPSPYSNCRDNVETSSSSDSYFYIQTAKISKYTRNLCYEVCFQYDYLIPNCNCSDASVGSNENNVSVCAIAPERKCLDIQRAAFRSSNCNSECPEVCERVEYEYKVSTSAYPSL